MRHGVVLASLIVTVCSLIPPAAVAKYGPRRWVAEADSTRAILRYSYDEAERPPDQVRLIVVRHGRQAFSELVPPSPRDRPHGRVTFYDWDRPLIVRDLDGDGNPEVLLDLFWSGTRCCAWTRVYRFDSTRERYVPRNHWWGNLQATYDLRRRGLRDLDGDGRPEFIAADDRFAELSYWSIDPIQIWRYDRGRFRDVTRRFPRHVARDARAMWSVYLRQPGHRGGVVREALTAWAADQYLLGHARKADGVLARALRRGEFGARPYDVSPRKFVAQLKAFLRKADYAIR